MRKGKVEHKIRGITFTIEELKETPLIDLNAQTISRSHIFYIIPDKKKPVLLLKAGDYVEESFKTKYLEKGMQNIFIKEVVSLDDLNRYKTFWESLKQAQTQTQQIFLRDQIIEQIVKEFYQNEDKCILSFLIACFDEFNCYPNLTIQFIQENSMTLYSRALLSSTVSVVTLLTNDYTDYNFIKDFYNVCFIMDYGLIDYSNFTYTVAMACEKERLSPGEGIKLLEKMNRPESEKRLFLNHPTLSSQYASSHSKNFINPELANMIKYHHEKVDGTGFPYKISYSALSDSETLLCFCDYMIPFIEHEFMAGDGHQILFGNFKLLKEFDGQPLLPVLKVMNKWESMMNWAINKNFGSEENESSEEEEEQAS